MRLPQLLSLLLVALRLQSFLVRYQRVFCFVRPQAKAATKDILAMHCIAKDRSDDLL